MANKRILITASRSWTDRDRLCREIVRAQMDLAPIQPGQYDYNDGDWTIVHGDCPEGGDAMADQFAIGNNYTSEPHPAAWTLYGAAAGMIRNRKMVKEWGAHICLAFLGPCTSQRCRDRRPELVGIPHYSHGATHCADYAEANGIPTRRFKYDREGAA